MKNRSFVNLLCQETVHGNKWHSKPGNAMCLLVVLFNSETAQLVVTISVITYYNIVYTSKKVVNGREDCHTVKEFSISKLEYLSAISFNTVNNHWSL